MFDDRVKLGLACSMGATAQAGVTFGNDVPASPETRHRRPQAHQSYPAASVDASISVRSRLGQTFMEVAAPI